MTDQGRSRAGPCWRRPATSMTHGRSLPATMSAPTPKRRVVAGGGANLLVGGIRSALHAAAAQRAGADRPQPRRRGDLMSWPAPSSIAGLGTGQSAQCCRNHARPPSSRPQRQGTVMKIDLAAATAGHSGLAGDGRQRTELGVLDCTIEGGAGFMIGSTKDLSCTFTPGRQVASRRKPMRAPSTSRPRRRRDRADGDTMAGARPTATFAAGALAGNYVGASAEATAAIGAGANVLVGGSNEDHHLAAAERRRAQTGLNWRSA